MSALEQGSLNSERRNAQRFRLRKTVPVLIGRGIPLFGALPRDVKLRHVATRTFPKGLVQSEYKVLR